MLSKTGTKKITYTSSLDIFLFRFTSRLVGNLLCMCDLLSKEYTTQQVGVSISIQSETLTSVSKVSLIYLLVNLLCIFRLDHMRQTGLTAKISSFKVGQNLAQNSQTTSKHIQALTYSTLGSHSVNTFNRSFDQAKIPHSCSLPFSNLK